MTRLKKITSHTGVSRFFVSCEEVGWIPNGPDVPRAAFSYGPTVRVYRDKRGRLVVVRETSHKVYGVFQVPSDVAIFKTDRLATEAFIKAGR